MEDWADTARNLREQAEWARRHARGIWPDAATAELLAYARELEEQAVNVVQTNN